jgi:hypothetical protein
MCYLKQNKVNNQYKTSCYNIKIYKEVAQGAETTPCGMLGASLDELQAAVFADRRPLMISKKKLYKN